MGRHGGPIPSKRQRLSTHVDPGSAPSSSPEKEDGGGAAGYCPRVRCVYYTPSFIAIAGPKPLPGQYRRLRLNEKWGLVCRALARRRHRPAPPPDLPFQDTLWEVWWGGGPVPLRLSNAESRRSYTRNNAATKSRGKNL